MLSTRVSPSPVPTPPLALCVSTSCISACRPIPPPPGPCAPTCPAVNPDSWLLLQDWGPTDMLPGVLAPPARGLGIPVVCMCLGLLPVTGVLLPCASGPAGRVQTQPEHQGRGLGLGQQTRVQGSELRKHMRDEGSADYQTLHLRLSSLHVLPGAIHAPHAAPNTVLARTTPTPCTPPSPRPRPPRISPATPPRLLGGEGQAPPGASASTASKYTDAPDAAENLHTAQQHTAQQHTAQQHTAQQHTAHSMQ
jgi:hypothetical protein